MENADKKTTLSINLSSINSNYKIIKKIVGKKCIVAATVKANAYGLGVDKIVPSLIKNGCKYFFVATTSEAVELRRLDKSIHIFILNGLITENINLIYKYNLIPVINSISQLKIFEKFQNDKGLRLSIAVHFDTGMSRLGFDENETNYLIKTKFELIKRSKVKLVMSHLACAENKKSKLNKIQLKKYTRIKKYFPSSMHSLSNSAGVHLGKNYHFDMVRPGISLYGGNFKKIKKYKFKNVVTLKAKIIQVREIKKGDTIGYGATYKAKEKMIVGTLSFGYADGFNRLFSNNYKFYYKNKKLPILGRVSMDLVTVDLSRLGTKNNLYNFDIEIINEKQSINRISELINTIPYEILTSIGKRYQRKYII